MDALMVLRGTVVGEPVYDEDSETVSFLLVIPVAAAHPVPDDLSYRVRCFDQLANQVSAEVYHLDPVIVLATPAPPYPRRADGRVNLPTVHAQTVGIDLSRTNRIPIV